MRKKIITTLLCLVILSGVFETTGVLANASMQNGWYYDYGWHYMSNDVKQNGWINDNGNWYYLNKNGTMQTGWINENNCWYYLNSNGVMAKGWKYIDNNWYYLKNNGLMATGWAYINENWYYLNYNGTMKSGWLNYGHKWYYLMPGDGSMAKNKTVDGYYLDNEGIMQNIINGNEIDIDKMILTELRFQKLYDKRQVMGLLQQESITTTILEDKRLKFDYSGLLGSRLPQSHGVLERKGGNIWSGYVEHSHYGYMYVTVTLYEDKIIVESVDGITFCSSIDEFVKRRENNWIIKERKELKRIYGDFVIN